jgi:hypothetical protein
VSNGIEFEINVAPAIMFAFGCEADVDLQTFVIGIVDPPSNPVSLGTKKQ